MASVQWNEAPLAFLPAAARSIPAPDLHARSDDRRLAIAGGATTHYRAAAMEDLEEAFARWDRDGNGFIDEAEFAALARELGAALSESELFTAFTAIDLDGNGRIELREFRGWWLAR